MWWEEDLTRLYKRNHLWAEGEVTWHRSLGLPIELKKTNENEEILSDDEISYNIIGGAFCCS